MEAVETTDVYLPEAGEVWKFGSLEVWRDGGIRDHLLWIDLSFHAVGWVFLEFCYFEVGTWVLLWIYY